MMIGCDTSVSPADSGGGEGLNIQERTENLIVATYTMQDDSVKMRSEQQDDVFKNIVEIRGHQVVNSLDTTTWITETDGDGWTATAEDKQLLIEARIALLEAIAPPEVDLWPKHESTLIQVLEYMSEAPEGHVMPTRSESVAMKARSINDESNVCINQYIGQVKTYYWDDRLTSGCSGSTYLSAGGTLNAGGKLCSQASAAGYWLYMQGDGNLVLYHVDTVHWASNTNTYTGKHPRLQLLTTGNLRINTDVGVVWQTNTSGTNNKFYLQADGNLVVKSSAGAVLWAAGSNPDTNYAINPISTSGYWKASVKVGDCFGRNWQGVKYNCMGRCGANCADNWGWAAQHPYTVDCMEHDLCSWFNNGSSYCDDEWDHAKNDYIWLAFFGGCDGGWDPLNCD
jgi:hypothetical protein